jgi:chromosome segregation ATPase
VGAIEEEDRAISELHASGTQFTCFTGTKVQILTYSSASVVALDQRISALGETHADEKARFCGLLSELHASVAAKDQRISALEDTHAAHAAELVETHAAHAAGLAEKERLEMEVEEAKKLLRTKERDFAAKLEDLEEMHAAELEEKERLEMDVEEARNELKCSKDALAKAGFVALQYH